MKIQHLFFIAALFVCMLTLKAQTLAFDTARFSSDGNYALIFERVDLYRGIKIPCWGLFKNGIKNDFETLTIHGDSVCLLNCCDEDPTLYPYYIQDGDTSLFQVYGQYKLIDFLKKYDLQVKAMEQAQKLSVEIDTLRRFLMCADRDPYNNICPTAFVLSISYFYNCIKVYTDTISIEVNTIEKLSSHLIKDVMKDMQASSVDPTNCYTSVNGRYFFIRSNLDFMDDAGRFVDYDIDDYIEPGVVIWGILTGNLEILKTFPSE